MSRKGFTLVELLVVISIISLLASVVLASLNSARDKGRLGGAKYFAAQVDHVAGDQAIGVWDFDDCPPSTIAVDQSGSVNTGTLNGAATWSTTNTPSGRGCSLSLSGSSYVSIGSNSSFRLGSGSVTISAWVYPSGNTGIPFIFVVGPNGNGATYGLGFDSTGNKIRPFFKDIISNAFLTNTAQSAPDNQWTQVVMVVNRSTNLLDVYINGLATSLYHMDISSITSTVDPNLGGVVRIGSDAGGTAFFAGQIDSVHVFTKALTAQEVSKSYANAIQRHTLADSKPMI